MTKTSAKTYAKDYTKPALRERLKEEILAGTKGGKAQQWSARKAQLLKKAYEEGGGAYKHSNKKTSTQKSLSQWSKEEWQTADGKAAIRDGKTTRYLPKKVWSKLSPAQKQKTDALKVKGSKNGKQMIDNPQEVKQILKKTRTKVSARKA